MTAVHRHHERRHADTTTCHRKSPGPVPQVTGPRTLSDVPRSGLSDRGTPVRGQGEAAPGGPPSAGSPTCPPPADHRTATSSTSIQAASTGSRPPLWKHGLAASVVASLTTTALASVASGAGVSFAPRTGDGIPPAGFAELTLIFSLLGVGIAAVMARRARRPRLTFVRTAVALTALSFVPDLTVGFDAVSAATLILLHVVAAAIVVPVLTRRLALTR